MNSGPTAERVYDALKQQILQNEFPPGARLDPTALAQTLASSATPVRDALHRLTGERLVETYTSDGFHLPQASEPDLQDLYDWHGQIILLALRQTPETTERASGLPRSRSDQDYASSAASVFSAIAARSVNPEHPHALAAAGDRLHAARTVEPLILSDLSEEMAAVRATFAGEDLPELRKRIAAYHRRRHRAAADIVRALYRER